MLKNCLMQSYWNFSPTGKRKMASGLIPQPWNRRFNCTMRQQERSSIMINHGPRILLALILLVLTMPAIAAELDWDQLSAEEQRILKPFGDRWETLSDERRQKLQKGAQRWQNMTPEQRQQAKQRIQTWKKLSPEEQASIRQKYQAFKKLPPAQQERIRKLRERFQLMPPERRKALRERWKNLSAEERAQVKRRLIQRQRRRE
ncbi:MAG: DUF3106 domain-containing protein [Sedimenticola selenatireducens]|uniref:DUF3106 domain-containing protein n=2 Tax=Sedimenticola selenatireducens TaxID=191960 RepID=A0A558DXN7_9GAMM|nr:DUF3106 domain-containing protein [Sedimenticola selenatireducens]TVT65842.1 MAG: DUF3106 domain-containing protein [Sedimenticola selenatireducens]